MIRNWFPGQKRETSTQRLFALFALTLALLTTASGCSDSTRITPAEKMSTAAALGQQSTPVTSFPAKPASQPAPPPPLAKMVPVKTFQVRPPAAFSGDQLPRGEAVEFEIPANAGQFLLVKVNEVYRVLVKPPVSGSAALEPGGDSSGKWFYALPQTGTYRVLFAPERSPSIEFAFLSSNDPMVDPGIKPEQISIDFGAFSQKEHLTVVPYTLNEDEAYQDSWPAHLAVKNDRFEFRIMTVEGYKKVFQQHQRMDVLEAALRQGEKVINTKKLPYPVYRGDGVNLSTRSEFLEGDGWHGLRWIGGFGQDLDCNLSLGGQHLGYVFEGISNDGRYFIMIRADISHPEFRPKLVPGCITVLEDGLAAATPDSFQPNLDQLDSVIRSLKLR